MREHIPDDVVDFLGGDISSCERYSLSVKSNEDITELRTITKEIFAETVKPYYADMGSNVHGYVHDAVLAGLKNAVSHGGGDVSFDLLFNNVGLVSSYFDGGEYFTDSHNKDLWENRIGNGSGSRLIYDVADLIHIDNPNGVLYMGLRVDSEGAD